MASTASDALILGGGFAGLSCAVELAKAGRRVVVLEKKPHLGGRAYSFADPDTKEVVDNGQHLFMGCYRSTRRFLDEIGTSSLLHFSEKIRVDYADSEGGRDILSCPAVLGSPLHLAWGVLGLKGLSLSDKAGLLRLDRCMKSIKRLSEVPAELDKVTVRQWLDGLGQSKRIQQRLFDPIALGALNDDPEVASATGFAQVLREIFYRDVDSTRLGVSAVGLSELYTGAARSYIEKRGGKVLESKKSASFIEEGGRVKGAVTESGERFEAAATISTLAPWDLKKLPLPAALRGPWETLQAAPIVSLCLWLDRPLISEPLVGMLGTEIQWVFNKSRILGLNGGGQYLSLVISGAHKQIGWEPKQVFQAAQRDLAKCFPEFSKAKVQRWKVVKEPFATLSPVPGSDALRPAPGSGMPGFHFAGDWTRTGLPATIESAVASGYAAAQAVLNPRSP
ncbi:MAG: FAD-dependent oxidoreductase [Elusimicrobia bacterium]|nr:FAD-dependent oxidoreductase [Elusimicrobiota bacterium]